MTTLRVLPDGLIEGLRVVGYHGRLGLDQTPAERGPGFVDEAGYLVRLLPQTSDTEVKIQRVSPDPLANDSPLPGYGTRVGPWPARLGYRCMIFGEPDRIHAHEEWKRGLDAEAPRVRGFLAWLAGVQQPSPESTAQRVDSLFVWYCSADEAACLRSRLAPHDRAHLLETARSGSDLELKDAALRLSRVAIHDADIYLAVAALRRVAYPYWQPLLDAGVSETRADEREAHILAARALLPERVTPPAQTPRPPVHAARSRVRGRAA